MNDFSDGWEDGWNACRKILCKKFDINEEVVIAWENSDKEEMNKGCGKEFMYLKNENGQITMPCGTSEVEDE